MQETRVRSLGLLPGGEVASHSDTVAWEALWTDVAEQATVRGSQGAGQD